MRVVIQAKVGSRNRITGYALPLGLIAVLGLGVLTRAASYLPITLKELTHRSKGVVEVQVKGISVTQPDDPRGVRTLVDLEVLHAWKGALPKRFTLDTPGGRRGETVYYVADAPSFEVDERAIVFVKEPTPGRYLVQDLGLGKFNVLNRNGKTVVENRICPGAIVGVHKDGSELHGKSIPLNLFDALITDYAAGRDGETVAKAEALAKRLPPALHGHVSPLGSVGVNANRDPGQAWARVGWAVLASALFAAALLLFLRMRATRELKKTRVLSTLLVLAGMIGLLGTAGAELVEAFAANGTTWNLDTTQSGRVEGNRVVWVPVLASQTNARVFTLVRGTYDQWENVPRSRIAFTQAAQQSNPGDPFDNDGRNVQTWDTTPSNDFSQNTLGITFTIFSNGTTIESDIIYNDRDFTWSDKLASTTALHEIGHQIGLDHVNNTSAVMHPTNQGIEQLSSDEIAGAQQLYPDPSDPGSTTGGGGGGGGSGGGANTAPPTAAVSASPASGSAPLDVSFDGTSSFAAQGNTITSFDWDFGDGTTSTGSTVSKTYSSPGAFTATLTITDSQGNTDSASIKIQVGDSSVVQSGNFKLDFQNGNRDRFLVTLQNDALIGIKAAAGEGGALADGTLRIGGAEFTFRFDRETARSVGDPVVKVKVQDVSGIVTLSVKNTDIKSELEVWGATNEDVSNKTVSISVYLDIPLSNVTLWSVVDFNYSAKQDKIGKAKAF